MGAFVNSRIYRMEESVIPPDNTFYYHAVGFITTLDNWFLRYIHAAIQQYQSSYTPRVCHCCMCSRWYASLPPFDCCWSCRSNFVVAGKTIRAKQSIDCLFDHLFWKIDSWMMSCLKRKSKHECLLKHKFYKLSRFTINLMSVRKWL